MKENENISQVKKKNNRKRRMLLLILLLGITGIMLTTTSYAWFTANETVTVNTITVNVAAQRGVQLSTDGTNWKSIIQTTDIAQAHVNYVTDTDSVNQLPNSLEPVSTVGHINESGRMEMFHGITDTYEATGDYTLTALQSVETRSSGATSTGKFIAFDLFFKLDTNLTTAVPLYLTTSSGVTTDDVTDTGIKNASRIAFVIEGHTDSGTALGTIQALNGGATATKYIWEPNYDVHTAAGVANANDVYGITAGATIIPYEGVVTAITAANNVLLSKANSDVSGCMVGGVSHPEYTTETDCTTATGTWTANINTAYFDPVTIDYSTKAGTGFDTYLPIFSVQKGITKVRVYMWIEGQDVDCENTASGGNINYDLQFSINNGA